MDLFPSIRKRRVLQSKIVKIEVYCYSRSPNDGKKWCSAPKWGMFPFAVHQKWQQKCCTSGFVTIVNKIVSN